jgi:hypothetical protein
MPTYEIVFRCAACAAPIAVNVRVDAFDPDAMAELTCPHCHHDRIERTAPTFALKAVAVSYAQELSARPSHAATAKPRRVRRRSSKKR